MKDVDIMIDEQSLHHALLLPISELDVSAKPTSDFEPKDYFKNGGEAFERNQGWKIADALEPGMGEWLRFVMKRLCVHRHATYLPKKLLYASMFTVKGMRFNWAAYVAGRMHSEMGQT